MPLYKTKELFDLSNTIAEPLLASCQWPWEALEGIGSFIKETGAALSPAEFTQISENVWVSKEATVAPSASITGPCIIEAGAEIRHCAFIRGNAIVGKNAVVGNSTELKNCNLFNNVQVPHFNYVGDSILGYKSHMGAGAVTSNVKSDSSSVFIKADNETVNTGRKKVGAMLGDHVEVGCNSVLCPGTVLGPHSTVYPTSCVRGVVPHNSIFKSSGNIVTKE